MARDTRQYPIYSYPLYSVKYYTCDSATIRNLIRDILDGTIGGIQGMFTNASDYVISARYYPFRVFKFFSIPTQRSQPVYLGRNTDISTAYGLFELNRYGYFELPSKKWFEFTLSRTFNNFLDFAPYTQIKLHVPLFSTILLPLEKCYGVKIECYLSVDLRNGNATISLFNPDGILIYTETKKIAIDLPIGRDNESEQFRNRMLNGISVGVGIASLGLGATSGNPLLSAGGVGLVGKTLTNAIQNEVDHYSNSEPMNETSSTYMNPKEIYLIVEQPQNVVSPNLSLKGGVCKQNGLLSSFSGYTEIGEIHFNPMNEDIFNDEIEEITDLLKSGVIL